MSNRDTGLGSGAGKGDAPRYTLNENYRANYDDINWQRPDAINKPHTVIVELRSGEKKTVELPNDAIEPEQRFTFLNKTFGAAGWRYINDAL